MADDRMPEDGWQRPWGEDPPPAPASASRREKRLVSGAWSMWSPFRPIYRREGDRVYVAVDLKSNGAVGDAAAATDAEAAWLALQACIENYHQMLQRGSLLGRALSRLAR